MMCSLVGVDPHSLSIDILVFTGCSVAQWHTCPVWLNKYIHFNYMCKTDVTLNENTVTESFN